MTGGSMFGSAASTKLDALREQIENLQAEIRTLQRQKREITDETGLSEQVVRLKKRIAELEITESTLTEKHQREQRETEHMVGLERKRAEFERTQAAREATLKVRESNLDTERKAFEERIEFTTKALNDQIGYLKDDIIKAVLGVLNVAVTKDIKEGSVRKAS